jgi:hypothetical protein
MVNAHAEPIQSVLSRLLELGCKPLAFGRPVARLFADQVEGAEAQVADAEQAAPPSAEAPTEAHADGDGQDVQECKEAVAAASRALVSEGGVLAALGGEQPVLRLRGADVDAAAWWCDRLRATAFSAGDSRTTRRGVRVYRLAGGPDDSGWSWFPAGASYGLGKGEIGRHIDLGLTVELEETEDGEAAAGTAALRLEAARVGVAPPTFACALVRARNAPAAAAPVRALLTAAPLHTYTLRDLLLARHELAEWENRRHAAGAVGAAGKAVATMLRKLSDARLLGLNLVPEHVVFTPALAPGADGEWDLQGVGLKTASHDLIEGEPKLTGFDARMWRRIPASDAAYDADAAWSFHGALLLGAAAAEFGSEGAGGWRALQAGFGDAGWHVNLAAHRDELKKLPDHLASTRDFGALVHRAFRSGAVGESGGSGAPDAVLATLEPEFVQLASHGSRDFTPRSGPNPFAALHAHLLGPERAARVPPRLDEATRTALDRAAAARAKARRAQGR